MSRCVITHLAAAGIALIVGSGISWWVQEQRYDLQLMQLRQVQTSSELTESKRALRDMVKIQNGLNDAFSNFKQIQKNNADAQQDLARQLLALRSSTAGVRSDFSTLYTQIERANSVALAEYASACTSVFEAMAAGGQRLAEVGGELARKAEEHAADEKLNEEFLRSMSYFDK